MTQPMKKLRRPRAVPYVVWTRVRSKVRVYGPYRITTALRYKKTWIDTFGDHLEIRVVKLERFEDLKEGMKIR